MGKVGLRCLQRFFCTLLFAQIEYKRDPFVTASLKNGAAYQNGHAAAIFAKVLFFEWLKYSRGHDFFLRALVALTPFGRCQFCPGHTTRNKIRTAVSQHPEKGFVSLDNFTFQIPDVDPNNVSVY